MLEFIKALQADYNLLATFIIVVGVASWGLGHIAKEFRNNPND